jgi:hypothetical protein
MGDYRNQGQAGEEDIKITTMKRMSRRMRRKRRRKRLFLCFQN